MGHAEARTCVTRLVLSSLALLGVAACNSPRRTTPVKRDDGSTAASGSSSSSSSTSGAATEAPAAVATLPGGLPGECAGPACWTSPDGFRFVHPLPAGETLRGVHVMPDGEVWAIGKNAALWRIKRGAGGAPQVTRITVPDVPTVASIIDDIDGTGAGARDFPGTQLMKLDFESIVARDRNDVWISIGEQDRVHWDGTTWRHHPYKNDGGEELMIGPDDKLWAAGELGAGLFSKTQHPLIANGTKLVEGPAIPSDGHIRAIAWQGKDVWVAGFYGLLFKSTGGKPFTKIKMPEERSYDALWLDHDGTAGYLVGDSRVYARKGDGFVEAHTLPGGSANAVYAFGNGEPAWFAGEKAWLLDHGSVREIPIDGFAPPNEFVLSLDEDRFEAVHGRAPDDVWFVGRAGMIAHYDGTKLTELFPRYTEQDIEGLAWLGDDRWLAIAADGALLTGSLARGITGTEPSPMTKPDKPRALATTRAGELILAGCHTEMFKRDKRGTWTKLPKLKGCVRAIAGADADHLWAVGSNDLVDGKAWRLSNGTWIEVPTGMGEHDTMYDVEVAANGDVWIAGAGALLVAKAGGAKLTRIAKHEHDEYRGISIRAPNDIWFATNANEIGSAGSLLHYNGKALERFDHLTANFLSAVVALPDGAIWAVGLGGVATHSADGKTFKPAQLGAQVTLDHLLAHPSGALLAGGSFGAIVQR
jgi:hypothetical protein